MLCRQRVRNRSRPIRGVAQQMDPPASIDDDAGRGDWQPVPPFTGEDLRAGEVRLGQRDTPRVVMAECSQRHDGQSPFRRLKAQIGPIEVEPQRRVDSEWRIPGHDQQQLVERRDLGGELRPIAEQPAAIDDPPDPLGGQRRQKGGLAPQRSEVPVPLFAASVFVARGNPTP
jgi:hypothetical protein